MKNHLGSVIIGGFVLIAVYVLGRAYQNRGKNTDSISVLGLGEENFTSDLIVWRASFSNKDENLKTAYANLQKNREAIRKYLISKGIKEKDIVFLAIEISKDFQNDYDENGNLRFSLFKGYILNQQLKVESKEVDKVESISREATELIDFGVELTSFNPEYYYTRLNELKIKMIESATKDAKVRAESIASNAGGDIGHLKSADLGVFQITGQNSSEEYAWGGSFNTFDKAKTARVTIRLKYEID